MFAPDVFNIAAPRIATMQTVYQRNGNKPKKQPNLNKQQFNKTIIVLLPRLTDSKEFHLKSLQDSDHYIVNDLKPEIFLDRKFIAGFINRGTFLGLSRHEFLEFEDTICITDGRLRINLCKESWQTLGITQGVATRYIKPNKQSDKYGIEINLNQLTEKESHRLIGCLSQRYKNVFTFEFIWTPPDTTICQSSAAKYFNDIEYNIELIKTHRNNTETYGISLATFDEASLKASAEDLLELFGVISLECDLEPDKYLSSYRPDFKGSGVVETFHHVGLFGSSHVHQLLEEIRLLIVNEDLPWACIFCQGFFSNAKTPDQRKTSYAVFMQKHSELLYEFNELQ